MRTVVKLMAASAFLAGSVATAAAQDLNSGGKTVTGRVEGVYVQAARGLYIETRLQHVAAVQGKQQWADVKLDRPTEDGRRSMLAELNEKVVVDHGDLVEITVARGALESELDPAPYREGSKIVRVAAKAQAPATMVAEGGQCTALTHADAQPRDPLAASLR